MVSDGSWIYHGDYFFRYVNAEWFIPETNIIWYVHYIFNKNLLKKFKPTKLYKDPAVKWGDTINVLIISNALTIHEITSIFQQTDLMYLCADTESRTTPCLSS